MYSRQSVNKSLSCGGTQLSDVFSICHVVVHANSGMLHAWGRHEAVHVSSYVLQVRGRQVVVVHASSAMLHVWGGHILVKAEVLEGQAHVPIREPKPVQGHDPVLIALQISRVLTRQSAIGLSIVCISSTELWTGHVRGREVGSTWGARARGAIAGGDGMGCV